MTIMAALYTIQLKDGFDKCRVYNSFSRQISLLPSTSKPTSDALCDDSIVPLYLLQKKQFSQFMPYSVPMPKQQLLPLVKNTSSRGNKKLLHSSKSITSASWPLLNNSIRHLSQGSSSQPARCMKNRKDSSHCPKLRASLPRLEYLSTPHPRTVLLPFNLVSLPHERSKKLPLLIAIKPENEKSERDRFMRANFNYNPYFVYRCPVDEDIMERYNTPSDQYLDIAVQIMENAIAHFGSYEEFEDQTGGRLLSRSQTLSLVRRYLKKEHLESEIQV